ncbi:hypothetical protein PR048_032403 [Dryococelus australis]|uniref:Uncharacterized protein n=1 Tax=Dryococelus australis TaxID=614101 RepID=A0ABQ9G228_9NEOP|nr:hypothetical protein PR048_032403 [Dryococelus australis]
MKLETIAARNRCQSAYEWQTLKFSRQKKYFLVYKKHPISQKRGCLLSWKIFFVVSICHLKFSEDNYMMVGTTRLAQYYHCANHSLNIALQDCVKNISLLRDCMQWVQEIGNIANCSPKIKKKFADLATDFDPNETHYPKPLYPTRWAVRVGSITSVINSYSVILQVLLSLAKKNEDIASKVWSLYAQCSKGEVYL